MASSRSDLNPVSSRSDVYPLLMDQDLCVEPHHAVHGSSVAQASSNEHRSFHPLSLPSSPPQENVVVASDPPSISPVSAQSQAQHDYPAVNSIGRSSSASSRLQLIPRTSLLRTSSSAQQRRESNRFDAPRRGNSLNSGLWISFEVATTVSQIIASIIVLVLSRNEKPRAPLALWVIGYTAGCIAILPFLYWRYKQHHVRQQEDDAASLSVDSSSHTLNSPRMSQSISQDDSRQVEDLERGLPISTGPEVAIRADSRIAKHVERLKMALDGFFAVWFFVGTVWVIGGHSSADEAPNLYRLCIVFLTFSCISYAMPFVICATVCCCLPCIVTLLSYREDHAQAKGALPDVIAALPVYKFRRKSSKKACKDENDSDSESCEEGGIFASGTEKERIVSGEDAVCCICLGKYKDGVDLKELHCAHFFHVECVETWLRINATCPLCKHEVSSVNADDQSG